MKMTCVSLLNDEVYEIDKVFHLPITVLNFLNDTRKGFILRRKLKNMLSGEAI